MRLVLQAFLDNENEFSSLARKVHVMLVNTRLFKVLPWATTVLGMLAIGGPRMVQKLEWIEMAQLAVSSILFKSFCRVAGGHCWPPAL